MEETGIRRRRLSAAERRKQILEQAFRLIDKQGFKSVSVRDIARAAEINEALIYKYFPTKDALLKAIINDVIENQPVKKLAPAQSKEEFQRALLSFTGYFLERNVEDGSIVRIVLYAAMEGFPLPDEFNPGKETSFLHWLAQSIEKGKQEWGFNSQADSAVAISQFIGGLIYFVLQITVVKMLNLNDVGDFKTAFVNSFIRSLE